MNKIIGIALAAITALSLGSCIKDDPDSCGFKVEFQYTYNMLSANALSNQSDQLMLYIFNQEGILVREYQLEGGATSVVIKELDAGRYSFAAWGRSNKLSDKDAAFDIPQMTVGQSRIEELKYRLRTQDGTQEAELNPFFVGVQQADIRKGSRESVIVGLKKVTKKIRVVVMPYTAGSDLDADDYSFRIEDVEGNGVINHDYSVADDAAVTYKPYFISLITPAVGENPAKPEIDRALAVEISTSRLIESHQPRLKITYNATGKEVVNINLPWLFSLTSMEEHRNWGLQEYLDRQDEYVITLFFRDDTWMDATIIINGWVVNNIQIEGQD